MIVVFRKSEVDETGQKAKNYYVQESVGIACGFPNRGHPCSGFEHPNPYAITHGLFVQDPVDSENEKAVLLLQF